MAFSRRDLSICFGGLRLIAVHNILSEETLKRNSEIEHIFFLAWLNHNSCCQPSQKYFKIFLRSSLTSSNSKSFVMCSCFAFFGAEQTENYSLMSENTLELFAEMSFWNYCRTLAFQRIQFWGDRICAEDKIITLVKLHLFRIVFAFLQQFVLHR